MSGKAKEVYSKYIRELDPIDRTELLILIENDLPLKPTPPRNHSLAELRGLGKEVWEGLEVDRYIDELRDQWEGGGS